MSEKPKGYQPTEDLKNPDPPSGGSGLKDEEKVKEIVVFAIRIQFENCTTMDKWVKDNGHGIFQTECDREKAKIEGELPEESELLSILNDPEYQIRNKIVRWKTWRKTIPE